MKNFRNAECEQAWRDFCSSVLNRDSRQFELYNKFYELQNKKEGNETSELEP